jgi:hypothetical protein
MGDGVELARGHRDLLHQKEKQNQIFIMPLLSGMTTQEGLCLLQLGNLLTVPVPMAGCR